MQMDNMFTPNHWESFCSEFGKNVNCVGVMVEGELEKDVRKREERNFMIHKCRIPASRVFNETYHHTSIEEAVRRLQAWSRPELVNFMIALCNDMEAGGIWGELLLHGVPEGERDREKVHSYRLDDGTVHGVLCFAGSPQRICSTTRERKRTESAIGWNRTIL